MAQCVLISRTMSKTVGIEIQTVRINGVVYFNGYLIVDGVEQAATHDMTDRADCLAETKVTASRRGYRLTQAARLLRY